MIEVLKHGEKKETARIITTRCPECGCVFRFNDDEDTYHSRIFCEDRIDCPDCGHTIKVHDTSSMLDHPEFVFCECLDEYAPDA